MIVAQGLGLTSVSPFLMILTLMPSYPSSNRYYGIRKISTPSLARTLHKDNKAKGKAGAATAGHAGPVIPGATGIRPIITVTEFSPRNTPDKVKQDATPSNELLDRYSQILMQSGQLQ